MRFLAGSRRGFPGVSHCAMPVRRCWGWSRIWVARIAGHCPSAAAIAVRTAFQHLVARAKSDADAVRDDLRAYPVDRPGDPMRCWWSICRPRNYAEAWVVRRRTAWGRGESQRRHSFTGGLLRFYTCPIER